MLRPVIRRRDRRRQPITMDQQLDFVIIGAGPAGEAAAYLARARGASVAIVDRELFGGSCPFWACMPSKTLLHAAAVHAGGGDYDWERASARRDYMISREGTAFPSDAGHVAGLEGAGAVVVRGVGRIAGPGRVTVTHDGAEHELLARTIIIAVGSQPTIPAIEGLDAITPWTNREATSTRQLPGSLVILGAGPTGVEMAQVFARYGVPTTLVASRSGINPEGPPPQLGRARGDPAPRRRGRPDRRPGGARAGRRGRRRARTSSTSPTARPSRATRSCSPSVGHSRWPTSGSRRSGST